MLCDFCREQVKPHNNNKTRGIARQKETWWWNEEVVALVKEKQRLFKLWKRPKKCKKGCRCWKTGGRKLCGHGRKAGNEGCSEDMKTWRQDYNQTKDDAKRVAELRKVDAAYGRLTIGIDVIQPVDVAGDLGVYFDSHLIIKAHVARVARTCFYHLRRMRSIRHSLRRDVTARLVSALVISLLDYCNSVLAHSPASTLVPLQRVINAAARMVLDLGPCDYTTPALYEPHWLPNVERSGGGNSTTAEEVSRFQCLFPNPNWLVWKGIPPPKTRSN